MKEQVMVYCYSDQYRLYDLAGGEAHLMIQIISGGGMVMIGSLTYVLGADDFLMVPPGVQSRWKFVAHTILHCCGVERVFISGQPYVAKVLREHPCSNGDFVLVMFRSQQAAAIGELFETIKDEVSGWQDDKNQAILIHLQMLLLLCKRGGMAAAPYSGCSCSAHSLEYFDLLKPLFSYNESWRMN